MKDQIVSLLQKVSGLKGVNVESPENEAFGDYSSNIALQSKNPKKTAEEIVSKLQSNQDAKLLFEKIEVAGPGFINFWLTRSNLVKGIEEIVRQGARYGSSTTEKEKKVMFEYGQPNTHKLPHIGHLFSYVYGEAMTRLMEAIGWEVRRVNYQGDVGLHVAKCLWALLRQGFVGQALSKEMKLPRAYARGIFSDRFVGSEIPPKRKILRIHPFDFAQGFLRRRIKNFSLEERVKLLQKMYEEGSKAYEENEAAKKEIQEINNKIYRSDPEIADFLKKTRDWSLEYYQNFERRLGIIFDQYYFESKVQEKGKEKVIQNTPKVFKVSQDAYIFEGSKFGLHDRVFVTGEGNPTYEAKDLYLEELKFKDWPMDLLVITTASEQNDYFKVVFKALEATNPEMKGKLKHVGFGMVNLKSGKMSSRTGEIIGAVELVETVVGRAREITAKNKELKRDEIEAISEAVGVGAVKYSFLKNNPLQDTRFDIEESVAAEGNSGPYLQYTVARANSVLAKADNLELITNNQSKVISRQSLPLSLELNPEELSVLRSLVKFPDVIEAAAHAYAPNLLCNYLYNLAQKFNHFYNVHPILTNTDSSVTDFRLVLTKAVGQVLTNGLYFLGIQVPERM